MIETYLIQSGSFTDLMARIGQWVYLMQERGILEIIDTIKFAETMEQEGRTVGGLVVTGSYIHHSYFILYKLTPKK